MVEPIYYDILRNIFKYLEPSDLYAASLVCRFWHCVAIEEHYARGPGLFELSGDCSSIISVDVINQFLKACLSKMLKFHMFFVYNEMLNDFLENCYCNYLMSNYYSLTIRIFMPLELRSCIVNMSIPDFYKIEIKTFTFLRIFRSMTVYCPELKSVIGFNGDLLPFMKCKFERYLNDVSPLKSCLILFCDLDNICLLKSLIASLENWYPTSKISIWGGVTREILICKKTYGQRYCMEPASCAFFFISHANLKIWSKTWPSNHETVEIIKARFEQFKLTIKFKTHSLGFMYIAGIRCPNYFFIECDIFQRIFPEVPFVYLYGPASLAGEGFKDFSYKTSKLDYLWEDGPQVVSDTETSIMILTYD